MNTLISIKDVEWEPMSLFDKMGKVFCDEHYYYRGIYNDSKQIRRVKRIFECGLYDALIKEDLILPIQVADIAFCDSDEFGMILQTRRIQNVLYPTEWSYSMLQDAARLMIKMEKVLLKYNYSFADYHPYNIVFEGVHAVHVDLGSIGRRKEDSEKVFVTAMEERYYRPLCMWHRKQKNITYFYLTDRRITEKEWCEYLFGIYTGDVIYKCRKFFGELNSDITILEKKIDGLTDFERKIEDNHWNWSKYQNCYIDVDGQIKPTKRFEIVAGYLKKYNVKSITELAANQGAFSQYCMQEGIIENCLAIDYDEWAIDKLYMRLKGKPQSNLKISTGVVDIISSNSRSYKKPSERMKNDAVVAMALIHHLILSQGISMKKALEIILSYGKKYAFIEYMPLGLWDKKARGHQKRLPQDYTLENFRGILSSMCTIVDETYISQNRILFIARIGE